MQGKIVKVGDFGLLGDNEPLNEGEVIAMGVDEENKEEASSHFQPWGRGRFFRRSY